MLLFLLHQAVDTVQYGKEAQFVTKKFYPLTLLDNLKVQEPKIS